MDISKSVALLDIFERLKKGEAVNKKEIAREFEKSPKTIQRYFNDIRTFYQTLRPTSGTRINYDPERGGHVLNQDEEKYLTRREILALCKILLESRGFCEEEMDQLLDKLLSLTLSQRRKQIEKLIRNEQFYYNPVSHNEKLINKMWELSRAINEKRVVGVIYRKAKGEMVERTIKPLGMMFSEYYFYLIAHRIDQSDDYNIPFRLDRIREYKIKNERFYIPDRDRFEEGKFRRRIQFMMPGRLTKIKFKYRKGSLEAVLDRLPTAEVIEEKESEYIIRAKVYGHGIKIWLLSQGDKVEVLEPEKLRKDIQKTTKSMANNYQ